MTDEELPSGWATAPLTALVDILDAKRIPVNQKDREARPGDVPYYGAAGQVGTIDKALFDEPLVLLGEDGVQFFDVNKPKAYLISGPAWVNNHAHVLRPTHINRIYLKHYLDQVDCHGLATGTTRLKLTQGAMSAIEVLLPPADEQTRIANELERRLSHVDVAVSTLSSALRRLWSARASIEYKSFWNAATPQSKLGQLLDDSGLTNGRSVRDRAGGFPVLRLSCLKSGRIDLTEFKQGDWTRSEATKYIVRRGDFLVSRGNGTLSLVGRGGLVGEPESEVAYPDTLIRMRPDQQLLDPDYLAAVWNSQGVRRQLEAVARTTAGIYKVNQGHLLNIDIPTPPVTQQAALVRDVQQRLSLVDAAQRAVEAALTKAAVLRRSLLVAAFSGQLVEQDPDDEPAEILLKRIEIHLEAATAASRNTRKPRAKKSKEPAA